MKIWVEDVQKSTSSIQWSIKGSKSFREPGLFCIKSLSWEFIYTDPQPIYMNLITIFSILSWSEIRDLNFILFYFFWERRDLKNWMNILIHSIIFSVLFHLDQFLATLLTMFGKKEKRKKIIGIQVNLAPKKFYLFLFYFTGAGSRKSNT